MKLKKEDHIDRIIFLKLFTAEILKTIHKREEKKRGIEKERIKQRISHFLNQKQNVKNEDNISKFIKKNYPQQKPSTSLSTIDKEDDKSKLKKVRLNQPPQKIEVRPIRSIENQRDYFPEEKGLPSRYKRLEKPSIIRRLKEIKEQKAENKNIQPEIIDMSGMNKINNLFHDKTILSIECRGPGKNLLVKRYNQINVVKIVLSQAEINSVIDYFSKRSRIPIAEGILKVAVEDMIIAAVTSELVGSKFIINKNSPYNLLIK